MKILGELSFLNDGGEMGKLIAAYNWDANPLGAISSWPDNLRASVGMLLRSRFPMLIFWGPKLITFYNDAFRPSLGNDGKHPGSLGQPGEESWAESWPVIGPMIYDIMKGGQSVWFEDQKLPLYRDGKMGYAYWTYSFSAVPNGAGDIEGLLVTCAETTKAVEGLQDLKDSRDELTFAIEAAELGTWDLNPATGRFTANTRLKEWFGLKPHEEIPLNTAVDVIALEDRQRVANSIARALDPASGGRYEETYAIALEPGMPRRYVLARGRAWFGTDGKAYRFNGTLQDITEQKLSEAIQREAEARFKNVANSSPTGLWLSDPAGDLTYVNKTLADWTGLPPAALLGAGWFQAVVDQDRVSAQRAFRHAVSQQQHYDTEFRLRKHDGSVVWCRAAGDPFYDDQGHYGGYAGFCVDIQNLKTVNERIEESRQQLLRSFEDSPVAIATIDRDRLTFTMANPFYGQLVGRKPEDIVGKTLLEALPEIAGQGFDALLENVIATGVPYISNEVPVELIRNGIRDTVYVDLVYQPQYAADESIGGVLVVATNITEQVRSRRTIEANEVKFRSLIEQAPFATALYVGPDLIIDMANEAMIKLWGKTAAVIQQPLAEALPELEGQPFIGLLQQVYNTGLAYETKEQSADLVVDGRLQRFWFSFTYKPVSDADGKVYGILNMAVDITEQVMNRKALEEAESMLRDAVDLAELATWRVDVVNGTVSYSERMQEWLGISSAELNVEASPRVHVNDRKRVGDAIKAALEPGGAKSFDQVYTIVHMHTGQERIIHASGQTVFGEQGQALFLQGTAQDVTLQHELRKTLEIEVQLRTEELAASNEELEISNEELKRSNEELSQYAYVASHDLQEPLRKIRVFSGMLQHEQTLSEQSRRHVDKISHSAGRMSQLISDLLDFSRLLNPEKLKVPVDLNQVLQDVKNDFELLIAEKQAVLKADPLPVISAIKLQMNQLFYNMISNALKFVRQDVPPEIQICCVTLNEAEVKKYLRKVTPGLQYYRISISDNGIGFDSKYAEQIFEVFKRLHGREEYVGSGIGLSLCRRIVVNHGGYLYSESAAGEGATFHIVLPG